MRMKQVTLGSISSALTVFGDSETAQGAGTQVLSLLLTLVATFFVGYARSLSLLLCIHTRLHHLLCGACSCALSLLLTLVATFLVGYALYT
jgi:hypothetical protein